MEAGKYDSGCYAEHFSAFIPLWDFAKTATNV